MKLIQKISTACAKSIISLGKLHNVNEPTLRYGCELLLTSFFGSSNSYWSIAVDHGRVSNRFEEYVEASAKAVF